MGNTRRKILIDARMYGLEYAGIGRYLMGLISELNNLGDSFKFIVLLNKKYFDYINLSENWKKVLVDSPPYSFSEQIVIPRILEREDPDLVHFPHVNVPIFWKGNYVLTLHDLIMYQKNTEATTLPLPIYLFKHRIFLYVLRIAIERSKKIITPSQTVADDLMNRCNVVANKIKVVYPGFDTVNSQELHMEEVLKKYNIKKPFFFYVGSAYPHKNLKSAVYAISVLNREFGIESELVIGGKSDVFSMRLRAFIEETGASRFVKMVGFIDENEKVILNKSSVGFLYPSLAEGFGLQGLEAISSGTLFLCSDIPIFREIYDNYAFYFNPSDPNSIALSMKRAMEVGSRHRLAFIKKSQEFIRRYSWKRMAKEILAVYNEALV